MKTKRIEEGHYKVTKGNKVYFICGPSHHGMKDWLIGSEEYAGNPTDSASTLKEAKELIKNWYA